MLTKNLPEIKFSEKEKTALQNYLDSIEEILKPKMVQLSKDEMHQYGKLGFATEQWANHMHQDVETTPNLAPPFIDIIKWNEKEENFRFLNTFSNRLESLSKQTKDSNKVIGFDIYHICLSVYNHVKYLSTQNFPGASSFYEAWKVFFTHKQNTN
ncbi:MAG: hypothetical protein K9I82_07170 [Chitinophagaceae bacterium]|nr:hypothetical protein [Chitinophagaceae bacterium]